MFFMRSATDDGYEGAAKSAWLIHVKTAGRLDDSSLLLRVLWLSVPGAPSVVV
jgi:hypothetical protein